MLSDTHNNKASLSVAKNEHFYWMYYLIGLSLAVAWKDCSSFRGCRLQRSPSMLDQFQKQLSPLVTQTQKTWCSGWKMPKFTFKVMEWSWSYLRKQGWVMGNKQRANVLKSNVLVTLTSTLTSPSWRPLLCCITISPDVLLCSHHTYYSHFVTGT